MDRLPNILNEIISTLDDSGEDNWIKVFIQYAEDYNAIKCETEKKYFKRRLLRIYGGMGSFSDLVLCKDMEMMYEENIKLDNLRSLLFEELKNTI